jgi:hypothetical protein
MHSISLLYLAFMNSFQVVLEKMFMNNFLLSEEITSAFPKLLGNCSWVLGQWGFQYGATTVAAERLIAQLDSQSKLATPRRKNRKTRH